MGAAEHMRNIASRSFKIALYATVALIVAAAGLTLALELLRPGADRLPFLNFELGLFKAILAGFVVSMLGILIPAVASEARQRSAQRIALLDRALPTTAEIAAERLPCAPR